MSNPAENKEHSESRIVPVSGLYNDWFLDYASYVILERAVPAIEDGLKPVQRRLLHSLYDLEDGRYNKVANIIGHTMKYHPHGDASIGDALVQLGQKDLLIDMQGNWGNIYTGDGAAAPRYIEARLSKFALEVVFNPKTTRWQNSYDGRNKEPVTLPVKFPLLLAQGVEGIAVGLSCKTLPHNFIELIEASIDIIKGKTVTLLPDFVTGGIADFSKYNSGLRGGKVRVRARIGVRDKKTLVISEIPFGTTTVSVIDSILSANDKGKIKIRKVEDNTSSQVEILVHLHPEASNSEKTIDALFAFTDCEVSISPLSCVIYNNKPVFLPVEELLRISVGNTIDLLKRELEIRKSELMEAWMFSSLEKIFIENRIYRDIEECETWEGVIQAISQGLEPFKSKFFRTITEQDIISLTEIKIKRISRFDSFKADEKIKELETGIDETNQNLAGLKTYAVNYFRNILKKYGKGKERKTEIASFETIVASEVVVNNQKLYVNRQEGFAGFGLKKDEFISECSDIDDIIVFRSDGTFIVSRISEKAFVGKDILHISIFRKSDESKVYNMFYRDGPAGNIMVKRFNVSGITRDKVYPLTKGKAGSTVLFFSVSGTNDAEKIRILLKPKPRLRNRVIDVDLNDQLVKGRAAMGNIVTRFAITKLTVVKDDVQQKVAISEKPSGVATGKESSIPVRESASETTKSVKDDIAERNGSSPKFDADGNDVQMTLDL